MTAARARLHKYRKSIISTYFRKLKDCARKEIEELDADISKGNFDALLHWLRENIHCHGSKFTPGELVKRITGNSMDAQPYLNYLRNKYSEIYKL